MTRDELVMLQSLPLDIKILKTKYFTLKKNIGGKYVIAYKNIPAITSLTFNTLDEIIKAYQLTI